MRADARRIGSIERLLHFKRIPALAGLAAHDLAALAELTSVQHFPEGALLLREGEPCSAAYFIVEGRVRLRREGADLGEVGVGTGIGALSILARDERGMEAVAATDTVALELHSDALFEILEDNFSILTHLLRGMARDLVGLLSRTPVSGRHGMAPPIAGIRKDLTLVDRIFILRQAPPFARASINALAELARSMTELRMAPGVTLWEIGDPARILYLLLEGEVDCLAADGRPVFHPQPGHPVGAMEAVAEISRWYRAVTATPVSLLSVDAEEMLDVFEDNFEMAEGYLSSIAGWLVARLEDRIRLGESALGPFYGPQTDLTA